MSNKTWFWILSFKRSNFPQKVYKLSKALDKFWYCKTLDGSSYANQGWNFDMGEGVYKMAQKVPMPLMDGPPHLQDPRGRVTVYRTFGIVKKSIHINWGSYWLKLIMRGYDILSCKAHIPFMITFCLLQSSNLLPWQWAYFSAIV